MKKKIAFIIATILSTSSAFSATGSGYKILDTEIYSAPGFNFHVEDDPAGIAQSKKKSSENGVVSAYVPAAKGIVNASNQVDGYHGYNIVNLSGKTEIYEEYIDIACGDMFSYFIEHVEIKPMGQFSENKHSFGAVQEANPGDYMIVGETKVISNPITQMASDANILKVGQ